MSVHAMRRRVPRKSSLLRWLYDEADTEAGCDVDEYDPARVRRSLDCVGRLFGPGRYFRLDVRGLDRVPSSPVLLVSNHSGGTSIPDAWGLAVAWYRHFGVERPLHITAHEMVFGTRASARYFATRGVINADRAVVADALSRGRDVLVMPGGDRDAWRPHRDRYRVRFYGHSGYAEVALRASIPIVPVANAGAHDTLFVVSDGHRLARAAGLHRIARADIWPVHLSLPWMIGVGPLPHIPLPVRLRYRIGAPIAPRDGESARDLDRRVRAAVQKLLDGLARESA
jgi:1-acyl-sn-glycerol-3-phosphate acyltransferase